MAETALARQARPLVQCLPAPPPALRWVVFTVLSLAAFASAYTYDCIGPLARVLATQLHFSNADIGLLQGASSVPNLGMVLIGGIVTDRIGVKKATAVFAWLVLAGTITTALSPRLGIMVAGRLLYGLGSGSLSVSLNTAIAKWFRGAKLSFVFGLNLTIARLGSLASQTGPAWARAAFSHWRGPLLLAILVGLLGFLCAAGYWFLETRFAPHYDLGPQGPGGKGALRGLFRFSRSYWLVALLCVTFYAGIFPFQTFAQKFLIEARGVTAYQASVLVGIPTVIAMVGSPLFGLLVDRVGRRALFMAAGTALLVPTYLLLGYGHLGLYLPMVMMGVAFALVPSVMWPAVMLIVPREELGKAFGLMSMIQSFGLCGFNFLIGWVNDAAGAGETHPAGYHPGLWLFTGSVLLGLVFALMLRHRECGPQGHGLER